MKKKMWHLSVCLLLMGSGLCAIPAFAHSNFTSANYIGVDDVQDSGGNTAVSAHYGVLPAICQTGIDIITSTNYINYAGFLHAAFLNPTVTATPTPTPSASATPTPTATLEMESATYTLTSTSTPLVSPSSTPTETMTPTSTDTHTATATSSGTPDYTTPTDTPTSSPTATVSSTRTVSATSTPTASITPTGTITPTITMTSTISVTVTITPTATISPTMSITPTLTTTPDLPAAIDQTVVFYPHPARVGQNAFFAIRIRDNILQSQEDCPVEIKIYNMTGEKAAEIKVRCHAGFNQVPLATGDMAAGFYFYRVWINGKAEDARKLVMIKY
ncbi:hypothetical protein JW933_08755 [candidate division FCPU426 bacterium]|nr:hypothetical protein [candidate division FCPU426 bacterium]